MSAEKFPFANPPSLRVLHIFARLNCGGAEMRTLELVRYYREHYPALSIETHFCSLSGLPGTLDEEARRLGCQLHYLPLKKPTSLLRFVQILRRGRYDVLHSHVHYPSGLFTLLAKMVRIPVRIVHFRSTFDGRLQSPVRRFLIRFWKQVIDATATHILAVSRAAMAEAWDSQWLRDPRCRVVYNGIDLARFLDPTDLRPRELLFGELHIPATGRLFVHVGRETAAKNHRRILSIFAELKKLLPEAQLLLVGDIPENSSVREEARRGGLQDSVHFLGRRPDVPSILAAADVMIFPSLWEGLPGAVLEALAAGTPVVASDIPSHREIADTFPGLISLVSLDESDRRWAEHIARQPVPRPQTRRHAREKFSDGPFTMHRTADELLTIWYASRLNEGQFEGEEFPVSKTSPAALPRRAA